ncbi:MAG: MBOAT family protein [Arenimonas sp.]
MLAAFMLELGFVLSAVLLIDGASYRKLAAAVALLFALLFPYVVPAAPVFRALLALMGLLAVVKTLQIAAKPARWASQPRIWHALVPFDIDRTARVAPALDWRLLSALTAYALLAFGAGFELAYPLPLTTAYSFWFRILMGCVLVYCGMEVVTGGIRFLHRLAGVDVAPIQRMPILSLSIAEFWSKRWNRSVSGWLNEFVFLPLVRRRQPVLALLAAFAASAALHAWMFFVAAGGQAALMAATFFLLQGVLVLAESRLHIAHWPSALRRVWTLGLLFVCSPLFVLPVLQSLRV